MGSQERKPVSSEFPVRKHAGQSESSGIGSESGPVIPELPSAPGYIGLPRDFFFAAWRRLEPDQFAIVVYIMGKTTSAPGRPEYGPVTMGELRGLLGKSDRSIFQAKADLKSKSYIKADARGRLKICPENIMAAPLSAARTCRPKEREAAMRAPDRTAALRARPRKRFTFRKCAPLQRTAVVSEAKLKTSNEGESTLRENQSEERQLLERPEENGGARQGGMGTPMEARADRAVVNTGGGPNEDTTKSIVGSPDSGLENGTESANEGPKLVGDGVCVVRPAEAPGLRVTAVETTIVVDGVGRFPVIDDRKPESYCHWNWSCPYLQPKPLPPDQNAYLARFLDPVKHIALELDVDHTLARVIWSDSREREPSVTVREVILVAREKEAEWSRQSDASPGQRIRSRAGALRQSVANAIDGPSLLRAREQAPHDLERDLFRANDILANSSSAYERARALAILAEAGSTQPSNC